MSVGSDNSGAVEISFDLARIDFRATCDIIVASSRGEKRTDEAHRIAFGNSVCAGAYLDGKQVGFGRVITDQAIFAYLADIIVWPEHRGKGIGKDIVRALLEHPDLADVQYWNLRTADAHGLYEKFGFKTMTDGMFMRFHRVPR